MRPGWQPSASLEALRQRARLLDRVRGFFREREVLEIETPLLAHATVTDPHLHSIRVDPGPETLFLQTSPEFAMKRLLAAGSGPVFQLGKAFRSDESGARHNPEFTLLEWYRPGFDDRRLMDEVEELVGQCLGGRWPGRAERLSYRELFRRYLDLDPHAASDEELAATARRYLEVGDFDGSRDDWLNLLLSHCVEPQLAGAVFISDYPAGQAALARVEADEEGTPVARRFELLVGGMELANGYHELGDPREQRRRFEADNARRRETGLPEVPIDERLLAALEHGLPDCAGVALGFDRLVMLAIGATRIDQVIPFPLRDA